MRMQRLDVTTTLSADRRLAVVAITGELDLGNAEQFWPNLERLLTTPSTELDAVILDATGLEFLDSSGLRVLLRGAKLAEGEGAAFRVVAPNPVVQRVLELAGVARALDLRSSLPEAFA